MRVMNFGSRSFLSTVALILVCCGSSSASCPVAAWRIDTAQAPALSAARIDARALADDLRALSAPGMEGRLTGSPGSRRAQAALLSRFKELGLQPLAGSFEQKFSFTRAPDGSTQDVADAANLVGMIPGTEQRDAFILVTAHYDHLGIRGGNTYHGADDNASGVAAMLAIAGWFVRNPPRQSLVVVAFDAEEQGFQGARHFVRARPIDLRRITAVVNMDMVGRGDTNVLWVAGTHHYPHLKAAASEAAAGRAVTVSFGHDRPGVPGVDDWTQSSDHGPFHSAGVPFLYFGVENHADYHKPTDTAERIPAAFHREATEIVLDTIRRLMALKPSTRAAAGQRSGLTASSAGISNR